MTDTLNVLFYGILVFVTINVFLSLMLWKNTKRGIYKKNLWFWLCNYICLGFQFFYPGNDEGRIIHCFGLVNITTIIAYSVYCELFKLQAKYLYLFAVYIFTVILTIFLNETDLSFTWKSLPYAVSMSIPSMLILRVIFWVKKETIFLEKFLGFIFLIWIMHAFTFPFFRMITEAQAVGWMTTYVLFDLLGIVMPAISIDYQAKTEKTRLNELVDKQTEMLTAALAEKELLLKILVHDISNPLTGMKWCLNKVEENNPIDGQTLGRIKYFHGQVEDIVKNVRLKQLEPDHQNAKLLSISKSVEEVKQIFKDQLAEKSIHVELIDHTHGNDQIFADQTAFNHNILSNFTSNAIKFSPANGSIKFEISRGDNSLTLIISDKGMGMSAELIKQIYSSKTLASTHGTHGEIGTGFGLSIAISVLESMGAKLVIDSQENLGTRVIINFPLPVA